MNETKEKLETQQPTLLILAILVVGSTICAANLMGMFPAEKGRFELHFFLISLVSSIPLSLLIALLGKVIIEKRSLSSIVAVRPLSTFEATLEISYDRLVDVVLENLQKEGFKSKITNTGATQQTISFNKEKKTHTVAFSENAFSGEITLERVDDQNTKLSSSLRLEDIVLIDTGEEKFLTGYLKFLLNIEDGEFARELPFTLMCGLYLSLIPLTAFFVNGLADINPKSLLISTGGAAAAMIVAGMLQLINKRRETHGFLPGIIALTFCLSFIAIGILGIEPANEKESKQTKPPSIQKAILEAFLQ